MYEALLKATPEYQKVAASFGSAGPAALFGLPPAGRALLYAALQKDLDRVLCIVTPGEAEATHFADDLKALGLTAAVFPPRDFMLRPVEGAGREYEYRRLSVLGALAGGRLQAVCVPAEALLQYTVPRAEFIQNTLTLKPGMVYNREALVARLFAAGYVRRSQVDGPGQFSVRGDIVDIYAPDMRQPARVEYWDDEIDSMSSFDLLTQRRDGALEKIYLSPAREVLFGSTAETAEALRSAIKKARGKHRTALEKATEADLSQLDSGLPISNIVLMGIGEPLDNYDNVRRFLTLVNRPEGVNIGMRHISLSTCGLVDKIEKLAERDLQLTLSVSLHSPDDESRSKIMPVNRRWPVDTLLAACRDYFAKTGRRISFEYTMIDGVSDSPEQAQLLAKKLAGMGAHVNMIPLNNVTESGLHTSSKQAIHRFQTILEENGITATLRRTLGSDIDASCGQLRRKYESN